MNIDMSDFFNSCPGLTAEERTTIQDSTNAIAELVASNEQIAIDEEVETILLGSL
jgi:hypothetical protein